MISENKHSIWFADLTHTAQGISAATFPLGVSYVYSYAKKSLEKEFDFKFFHSTKQQDLISTQLKLYSNHAIGMGKMLQRTNLKLTFRNFAKL